MNVCKRPLKETFGLKDVDDLTVAGFVRRDHGDFSIGAINTTLSMYGSNVRMMLTGGSWCTFKSGASGLRASTIVDFVCDTSVFGAGEPQLVAQFPPGDEEEAACPTNEPGGAWGFLALLIFILIGLALLYLVAGTLYNRYVLRLQGSDQIPRFSLESMRYHASEAVDWFKDLTGIGSSRYNYRMPEEGLRTPFPGENTLPHSAQGTGGLNPVSHHTQVSNPESAGASPGSRGDAFVRPYTSRTTSASGKKPDINPVSHQAQSSATGSAAPPPLPPKSDLAKPPPQPQPQEQARSPPPRATVSPISPEPAPAKKEKHRLQPFDLGDDDDDEVNLGSATSAVVPPRQVSAAEERGRDLGDGGVIRL
ncbi:hypothetical protein C0995_003382 [Termitomyces sp. Mi166|nr:hypothetical protein C0995_003382 [Termitomyces sp. Mi166\